MSEKTSITGREFEVAVPRFLCRDRASTFWPTFELTNALLSQTFAPMIYGGGDLQDMTKGTGKY